MGDLWDEEPEKEVQIIIAGQKSKKQKSKAKKIKSTNRFDVFSEAERAAIQECFRRYLQTRGKNALSPHRTLQIEYMKVIMLTTEITTGLD